MKAAADELWLRRKADGPAYRTSMGRAYQSKIESFLDSREGRRLKGRVNLVMTSPPFPLAAPKEYGNTVGSEYLDWMSSLAAPLAELLTDDGSIVMEIGNAWQKGEPVMSTVPLETLLAFGKSGGLSVCQQFICHNPARLPSPAPWVTVKRIRLKDSFTHLWWYSKTPYPKADNTKVLRPYSSAMVKLLERQSYNHGRRPSEHVISETGFLKDNGGSIESSVLTFGNTASPQQYRDWCKEHKVQAHPARMQAQLVEHFVQFLTDPGDLVFDPFGGSNTTGWVAESLKRKWVVVEPRFEYLRGSMGRFLAPYVSTR